MLYRVCFYHILPLYITLYRRVWEVEENPTLLIVAVFKTFIGYVITEVIKIR